MSRPQILLCCLLLGSLAVSAPSFAKALDGSRIPLAEPRPLDQAGFPRELYRRVIPADNPQTPAKVALGEELFFDKRLSDNNTMACAGCHQPAKAFTDQRPVSERTKLTLCRWCARHWRPRGLRINRCPHPILTFPHGT